MAWWAAIAQVGISLIQQNQQRNDRNAAENTNMMMALFRAENSGNASMPATPSAPQQNAAGPQQTAQASEIDTARASSTA